MIIGFAIAAIAYHHLKRKRPAQADAAAPARLPVIPIEEPRSLTPIHEERKDPPQREDPPVVTPWFRRPDMLVPLLAPYWPIKVLAALAFQGRKGPSPLLLGRILLSVIRPERLLAEFSSQGAGTPVLMPEAKPLVIGRAARLQEIEARISELVAERDALLKTPGD